MVKVRCALGGIFVVISICILLSFFVELLSLAFTFSVWDLLVDLFGMSLCCFAGFYFLTSGLDNRVEQERLMQCSVVMVFVAYIVTMGILLLTNSQLVEDQSKIAEYNWQDYVQLIPGRTIVLHITRLLHRKVTLHHEILCALEHLCKFAPLGFMIPFIYKKCTTAFKCVCVGFLCICSYGTVELALKAGIQDIDYFFFNLTGIYLTYRFLGSTYMKRVLQELGILQEEENYFDTEL